MTRLSSSGTEDATVSIVEVDEALNLGKFCSYRRAVFRVASVGVCAISPADLVEVPDESFVDVVSVDVLDDTDPGKIASFSSEDNSSESSCTPVFKGCCVGTGD